MNETTFWQMIEQAKTDSGGDGEEQNHFLCQSLKQLDPAEILVFAKIYQKYEADAYREDVWDAADFIAKGCSDSSFVDFRAWLIVQGEDDYRFVLQDPDNLAEIVFVEVSEDYGKFGDVMSASLFSVAITAYEELVGEDQFPVMPYPQPLIQNRAAHVNSDDSREFEQYLKARYPRIAAKFWDDEDYS